MSVVQRVMICRLLEKMEKHEEYSEKLGLENVSTFHGVKIVKEKRD